VLASTLGPRDKPEQLCALPSSVDGVEGCLIPDGGV